jgi:periplasmic protein TonB
MSKPWLKDSLLNRNRLSGFILVSLGIHLTSAIVHMALPVSEEKTKGPRPIQVKYIEQETTENKTGKIIDTPTPPKKIEKPRTKELLAKYDSRSHSNIKKKTFKTYQRKKTVVQKAKGSIGRKDSTSTLEKKIARKLKRRASIKPRKKLLSESDIGKYKSMAEKKPHASTLSSSAKAGTGSSMALLDGFDPEPFASLNTEDLKNIDDDIPVSLGTKEIKYASYFARIKHQIELVWVYPTQAAEFGISGDLTLTFRVSKDGNLLGVHLLNRSGYEILDVAALKAVKEAAPFYPFPATIQREKLSIQANFVYTPQFEPITQ